MLKDSQPACKGQELASLRRTLEENKQECLFFNKFMAEKSSMSKQEMSEYLKKQDSYFDEVQPRMKVYRTIAEQTNPQSKIVFKEIIRKVRKENVLSEHEPLQAVDEEITFYNQTKKKLLQMHPENLIEEENVKSESVQNSDSFLDPDLSNEPVVIVKPKVKQIIPGCVIVGCGQRRIKNQFSPFVRHSFTFGVSSNDDTKGAPSKSLWVYGGYGSSTPGLVEYFDMSTYS